MIADDRVGRRARDSARRVEAVEIEIERRRQAERVAIRLGERELKAVERRKRLQLDQLRLDRAVGVAHQAEIDLQERRQSPRRRRRGSARARRASAAATRLGVVEDLIDRASTPVAASVAISERGKKQGVSQIGKPSVAPVRVSSRATRSRYRASVHAALNAAGVRNQKP